MTSKSLSTIASLTQNSSILIIGTISASLNMSIDKYFFKKEYLEFNQETIDILNKNLYKQYDVILFSFDQDKFKLFQNTINHFPAYSMLLIEDKLFNSLGSYINSITSLAILPITEELFIHKIFNILCIRETNYLLKSKEKIINKHKQHETTNNINDFLDKYSGSIIFLNDDLNDYFTRLKELEISSELFKEISSNILQLGNIFKQNENFLHLSMIIINLADVLSTVDLESVDPSSYNAFDYLTSIIEDITIYLDELFIYRLFKDVKLFEDSLSNNIKFFKDTLIATVDEDDDNLEFF